MTPWAAKRSRWNACTAGWSRLSPFSCRREPGTAVRVADAGRRQQGEQIIVVDVARRAGLSRRERQGRDGGLGQTTLEQRAAQRRIRLDIGREDADRACEGLDRLEESKRVGQRDADQEVRVRVTGEESHVHPAERSHRFGRVVAKRDGGLKQQGRIIGIRGIRSGVGGGHAGVQQRAQPLGGPVRTDQRGACLQT